MKDHQAYIQRRDQMLSGGGNEAVCKQHAKGKHTARERLALLFDPGTFEEIGAYVRHRCTDFGMEQKIFDGDGVVGGYGKVHGRTVFAYAQDFTVLGGSMGHAQAEKICLLMKMALKAGAPVVGMNDSGGARIQEGVDALDGYGKIFFMNTRASGVIPQITAILGPCAGGAVYSPALTDFVFAVDGVSRMFITGPDVIRAVTGEQVTAEELGGARTHSTVSGNVHFRDATEEECIARIRQLLSYLPEHRALPLPLMPTQSSQDPAQADPGAVLPNSASQTYDMHAVVDRLVDGGETLESMCEFAPNILTLFARIGGQPVGIIANQPRVQAGCLDVNASDKAARFVRACDAFGLPLITLVDVPGFLPGLQQEYAGIIRHGAKLLYAYSEATVPKITVILRKAYGGAYLAMCSKSLGADLVYAWDSAEIAVMGGDGAAKILARDESDRSGWIARYKAAFLNPYRAAEHGYVDDVILPQQTRSKLLSGLDMLRRKPRSQDRHGNIPL